MIFLTFLPSALVVMIVCSVVGTSSVDAAGSREFSVASDVCAGCVSVMFVAMLGLSRENDIETELSTAARGASTPTNAHVIT